MSTLWLCCTINSGKERAGADIMSRHGISALRLERRVRTFRRGKKVYVSRQIAPGYLFVARDGSPYEAFETRLLSVQWPGDEHRFRAIRGAHPGDIADIIERPEVVTRRVVHRILGWCGDAGMQALIAAASEPDPEIAPPVLKAGDRARILLAAGYEREVVVTVTDGKRARILLDGREVSTTMDRLEAA